MKNLAIIVCLLAVPHLTFAGTVTVSYSGLVQFSSVPNILVGTPFTGGFKYNTTDPLAGAGANSAAYRLFDLADNLTLSAGGFTFVVGPSISLGMLLLNQDPSFDPNIDYLAIEQSVSSSTGNFSSNYPGLTFTQSSIQIIGNTNFLKSLNIPDPFDIADVTLGAVPYAGGGFISTSPQVFLSDGSNFYAFSGDVTSIQASEAPEPQTWLLLWTGLAVLMAKSRMQGRGA